MSLHKLEEFDPNYRETFGGDDVKGLEVYNQGEQSIGTVTDAVVDQNGRFRYLVINANVDNVSKTILLPIGLTRINYPAKRVYINELSRQQIENLPEYQDNTILDDNYEEKVRHAFRSPTSDITFDRETYTYQQEPALYDLNEQYHQTLRLYEERLIASKHRVKTGEVAVGKHIETEVARVGIPIQKERVVIERVPATATGTFVDPKELKFQEGEVARIEVYEETPDIHKEAFVREEVRVRKVIDRDMVEAQDTIRREELDVNTAGDIHFNETDVRRNEAI
ncbi:conserved domain protein, TIGR02271+C111 [Cylindrospermum stagnale PCC 7417]|uniref:Conserved domain protein, TIGR02271+C111 n=1 Tax=Cylindrospermum stagnale PCC 7417 TaxID=56107 RepID=K9X2C1_9NOST|nr:DUF2382 domain-containing protein [Cylindrospermum stagnale]AFZ26224.1 conserved domain protein, TIGR02271+C111 [Cylindrospermum stagnale PCC 7417]